MPQGLTLKGELQFFSAFRSYFAITLDEHNAMVRVSKKRLDTAVPACRHPFLSHLISFYVCFFERVVDESALFRYTPSQADVHAYKSITAPVPSTYPHVSRWYSHITSYSAEFDTLPGSSTAGQAFTQTAAAASAAPAAAAEEEEIDLFGEDEEVDEEAEKIKAERVAAYNVKKAGKPKAAAKVCALLMDVIRRLT